MHTNVSETYRAVDLIFPPINLRRRQPAFRMTDTIVVKGLAGSECAVNELERLVAIHSNEHRMLEVGFAFDLVHTGGTHVEQLPMSRVTPECHIDSGIYVPEDFEVNVICDSELSLQRPIVSDLHGRMNTYRDGEHGHVLHATDKEPALEPGC